LINLPRGVNGALGDPIEQKWLNHAKHIGNIIFSCSGFVIFLIVSIVFAGVLATNAEQVKGIKRLIAPIVVAIPALFTLFFEAEAGKSIVAYRDWRNDT